MARPRRSRSSAALSGDSLSLCGGTSMGTGVESHWPPRECAGRTAEAQAQLRARGPRGSQVFAGTGVCGYRCVRLPCGMEGAGPEAPFSVTRPNYPKGQHAGPNPPACLVLAEGPLLDPRWPRDRDRPGLRAAAAWRSPLEPPARRASLQQPFPACPASSGRATP